MPAASFAEGAVMIGRVLTELGLAASNSQAMQLIKSGAVSVNGTPVSDAKATLGSFQSYVPGHFLLRRGKRQWALARVEPS
jgi:tyrosyl-tRNA synthetase